MCLVLADGGDCEAGQSRQEANRGRGQARCLTFATAPDAGAAAGRYAGRCAAGATKPTTAAGATIAARAARAAAGAIQQGGRCRAADRVVGLAAIVCVHRFGQAQRCVEVARWRGRPLSSTFLSALSLSLFIYIYLYSTKPTSYCCVSGVNHTLCFFLSFLFLQSLLLFFSSEG